MLPTEISKDIMREYVPPLEVLSTDVEFTIVGGKVVYEKPIAQWLRKWIKLCYICESTWNDSYEK